MLASTGWIATKICVKLYRQLANRRSSARARRNLATGNSCAFADAPELSSSSLSLVAHLQPNLLSAEQLALMLRTQLEAQSGYVTGPAQQQLRDSLKWPQRVWRTLRRCIRLAAPSDVIAASACDFSDSALPQSLVVEQQRVAIVASLLAAVAQQQAANSHQQQQVSTVASAGVCGANQLLQQLVLASAFPHHVTAEMLLRPPPPSYNVAIRSTSLAAAVVSEQSLRQAPARQHTLRRTPTARSVAQHLQPSVSAVDVVSEVISTASQQQQQHASERRASFAKTLEPASAAQRQQQQQQQTGSSSMPQAQSQPPPHQQPTTVDVVGYL